MSVFSILRRPLLAAQMRTHLQSRLNLTPAPRILEANWSIAASRTNGWSGLDASAREPQIQHFKIRTGSYGMQKEGLRDLSTLIGTKMIPDFCLDISDVIGLSNSKTDLTAFVALHDLATKASPELLKDATPAGLQALLAHPGFPIIGQPHRKESFEANLTDGRVFLNNSDGSHHFAAARTIASQLNLPVPLSATMEFTSIDLASLQRLRTGYEMYFISHHSEFHSLMEKFQAPYCLKAFPSMHGIDNPCLILLHKSSNLSQTVANVLAELGFQDVGRRLAELQQGQWSIEQNLMAIHDRNSSLIVGDAYQDVTRGSSPTC